MTIPPWDKKGSSMDELFSHIEEFVGNLNGDQLGQALKLAADKFEEEELIKALVKGVDSETLLAAYHDRCDFEDDEESEDEDDN